MYHSQEPPNIKNVLTRPAISVLGFHMKLKNVFFPFVFRRVEATPPPAGGMNRHRSAQFPLLVSEALFIVPKNEHFRRSKIRTISRSFDRI